MSVSLIITYRNEFEPSWIGRPYVTALILNRLGESKITAIIDSLTGNKLLSPSVRQDIIERTDGIPPFVEEMTKAVLEAESEGNAQKTAAAIPLPALEVPARLHASLMARIRSVEVVSFVALWHLAPLALPPVDRPAVRRHSPARYAVTNGVTL